MPAHKFALVIKQAALTGILVLLIAFLLAACTSPTDETLSSPSTSQSAAAVPGEKMPDEDRYAPGPMGSSSVRW
jgi:starvation-inducible outer membrane lipoprotein